MILPRELEKLPDDVVLQLVDNTLLVKSYSLASCIKYCSIKTEKVGSG